MTYMYLVATSQLDRVLLYQFSEKSKFALVNGLSHVESSEVSEESLRVGLYKLFTVQLEAVEHYETIKSPEGDSHVFFKVESLVVMLSLKTRRRLWFIPFSRCIISTYLKSKSSF